MANVLDKVVQYARSCAWEVQQITIYKAKMAVRLLPRLVVR